MSEDTKKNILILGGGLMQKPAILCAREEGFKVCVVDADENALAIPYAHTFCRIDLKDFEGIADYAEELQKEGGLAGVFTAGTDFSYSVSYACNRLGLPSHSPEAARNASVKTLMRECFKKSGVPSPNFAEIRQEDYDSKKIRARDDGICIGNEEEAFFAYPLVIKPADNMGARGCRMIRSKAEAESSVKTALMYSRSKTAILEEYMDGQEFSIDALVYDGSFTVTGFARRHIKYQPYFIEVGHTMPAILDKSIRDELISVFACGAKALGLSLGAAKADIKFTKKGAMIGEIAGRLSGGYMSGWTYPYASDLNLTKQALAIATGRRPVQLESRRVGIDFNSGNTALQKPFQLFEVPCLRTSAERAWISIPGKIEYIEEIKEYTDQAVRDVLPRPVLGIGSSVNFPRNNVEKCGNVISVSQDSQLAVSAAEDAVSNIFISLKPCVPETDDFIMGKENPDERGFPPPAFASLSEAELSEITGQIEEDSPVSDKIPQFILEKYGALEDWSYSTICQTCAKFDILRKRHPAMDARKFWNAMMRGGLQAAVYVSDSVRE